MIFSYEIWHFCRRYIHNQEHTIWLGCVQIWHFYLTLSRVIVFSWTQCRRRRRKCELVFFSEQCVVVSCIHFSFFNKSCDTESSISTATSLLGYLCHVMDNKTTQRLSTLAYYYYYDIYMSISSQSSSSLLLRINAPQQTAILLTCNWSIQTYNHGYCLPPMSIAQHYYTLKSFGKGNIPDLFQCIIQNVTLLL